MIILPENYATLPLQRKAHLQLARHVQNIRRPEYNNDVGDVFLNRKDWENVTSFPSCAVLWGPEECLTSQDQKRSMGYSEWLAHCFLHWNLEGEDPSLERALIKADCQRYFEQDFNYWLPEVDDGTGNNPTCFALTITGSTPFGDDQTIPRCRLEIQVDIYYRTIFGNPYERG